MRQNILRDIKGRLLERVCKEMKIEPELIPSNNETAGNVAEKARLDISARAIWGIQKNTFFDIRVTHPNATSNMTKSLEAIYESNENQKKRFYNDRVLHVEKASFTPLVFTTTGGMGKECTQFNKRLAEMISEKKRKIFKSYVSHKDKTEICIAEGYISGSKRVQRKEKSNVRRERRR